MNKSVVSRFHTTIKLCILLDTPQTYHVLHQGRAEYTLITPTFPPTIEVKVMGTGPGETRQLLVGTGVWKRSRILPEDRALAKTTADQDKVGCLITEVVVPGFHWEGELLPNVSLPFHANTIW